MPVTRDFSGMDKVLCHCEERSDVAISTVVIPDLIGDLSNRFPLSRE